MSSHDFENNTPETGEVPSGWTPEKDADARWKRLVKLFREAAALSRPAPEVFDRLYERVLEELAGDLEADGQWEGIAALLRESDRPATPNNERFEAMRRAALGAKDTARIEQIAPAASVAAASADDSFAAWSRNVLSGGGMPANLLRLAAVGILAFFLGANLPLQQDETSPSATVASAPTQTESVASEPPSTEAMAQVSAPATADIAYEPNFASVGSQDSYFYQPVGSTIEKGIWTEEAEPQAAPPQGWLYPGSYGAMTVSSAPSSSIRPFDLVQQIRMDALMERDDLVLEKIRQLEDAIAPILVERAQESGRQSQALEQLRHSENLLASGEIDLALEGFNRVENLAPGTTLAFLSRFQKARINFELKHDFSTALQGYRSLLEDYPASFLTEDHRAHILQRIDVLTLNHARDWRAVELWLTATQSSPERKVAALKQIIADVPGVPLAADAANQLVALSGEAAMEDSKAPQEIIALFDDALTQVGDTRHAVAIQYAKAEIVYRHMMNPAWAKEEFQRVLELPHNKHYAPRATLRLTQIERMR